MDLPDFRWNVTRAGKTTSDKALKCYQDQMGGVFGWIQPFVGILLTMMAPLFAYLGAKKKNRSLLCASCVLSFVCGVLSILGIALFIIAILVASKAITLPTRGGG